MNRYCLTALSSTADLLIQAALVNLGAIATRTQKAGSNAITFTEFTGATAREVFDQVLSSVKAANLYDKLKQELVVQG